MQGEVQEDHKHLAAFEDKHSDASGTGLSNSSANALDYFSLASGITTAVPRLRMDQLLFRQTCEQCSGSVGRAGGG